MQWRGRYKDWQSAFNQSTNYEHVNVIDRVRESALKAQRGQCAFERDGVCFDHQEYRYEFLSAFYFSLSQSPQIQVLDFGGSLASLYYQHRALVTHPRVLSWNIIEQQALVDIGQKEFQTSHLKFFSSAKEIPLGSDEFLILSSVLSYLPNPWEILEDLLTSRKIKAIWIDRTGFSKLDHEFIAVQHVPASIYEASYPCQFLSESRLRSLMKTKGFKEVYNYPCDELETQDFCFKGFLFVVEKG